AWPLIPKPGGLAPLAIGKARELSTIATYALYASSAYSLAPFAFNDGWATSPEPQQSKATPRDAAFGDGGQERRLSSAIRQSARHGPRFLGLVGPDCLANARSRLLPKVSNAGFVRAGAANNAWQCRLWRGSCSFALGGGGWRAAGSRRRFRRPLPC